MKTNILILILTIFGLTIFGQSKLRLDSIFQEMVDNPQFHNMFCDTLKTLELKCTDLPTNAKVYYKRPATKNDNWKNHSHVSLPSDQKTAYQLNGKVKIKRNKMIVTAIYVELIDSPELPTFQSSLYYEVKYRKTKSGWKVNKNRQHNIYLIGKSLRTKKN